ncbi:hypothetical protein [Paenibacillus taichungensis]|uniref:hypothetical protein n=1 Tax=Paenibacillus taichungensis TaxID=484184 RepID=UPI002871CA80|nr:hypothetical protein [Paenibacillus taichungensis]MDR9749382.1 hypothetical protein [Paenibacillus taichungensis]
MAALDDLREVKYHSLSLGWNIQYPTWIGPQGNMRVQIASDWDVSLEKRLLRSKIEG